MVSHLIERGFSRFRSEEIVGWLIEAGFVSLWGVSRDNEEVYIPAHAATVLVVRRENTP
jgi:hypothetical protein